MNDKDDFAKQMEIGQKRLEKVWPKKIEISLRIWKRRHDAGRVPDDYYEKIRKALLKSLDDWNKRHGKS